MWVTFIVEFKIQPIMCNIYRGMEKDTTYYVEHLSWNSKYNLFCVEIYRGIHNTTHYVGNIHPGIQNKTYFV